MAVGRLRARIIHEQQLELIHRPKLYKEHEKSPEIKNPNFSFMDGMERLEKETLLETIRFRREDSSIWNTAEVGK
jgi:hypothetical protein